VSAGRQEPGLARVGVPGSTPLCVSNPQSRVGPWRHATGGSHAHLASPHRSWSVGWRGLLMS
jgi:photosystem II stability/assembly factor-like uncharacterized protein